MHYEPTGPNAPANLPAGTAASTYTKGGEPTGVEVRVFGASNGFDHNPLMPNAYGMMWRQIGDEHMQTAGQIGWAGAMPLGSGFAFGRLMFDVINSQRTLAGRYSLADIFLVSDIDVAALRARREADPSRARRNFERHVLLRDSLVRWYAAIDRLVEHELVVAAGAHDRGRAEGAQRRQRDGGQGAGFESFNLRAERGTGGRAGFPAAEERTQ